jgi:anti-sigma B factor antagonist
VTTGESHVELVDGTTVVHVVGDLDVTTVKRFREAVVTGLPPGPLLVDLGRCDFLDSAGLHLLFQLVRPRDGRRTAVSFLVPAECPVARVVEIAGLALSAPVRRTLDEARSALAVPVEGAAPLKPVRRPGSEAG